LRRQSAPFALSFFSRFMSSRFSGEPDDNTRTTPRATAAEDVIGLLKIEHQRATFSCLPLNERLPAMSATAAPSQPSLRHPRLTFTASYISAQTNRNRAPLLVRPIDTGPLSRSRPHLAPAQLPPRANPSSPTSGCSRANR